MQSERLITAFTIACHLFLSWATLIQSIPSHPTSWRSILTLFSYLCLDLSSGLLPSGFPTKTLYTLLLSLIHATYPTHLILLNLISQKILGKEYRSLSSLCSVLHSPVTSSLLDPSILPQHPILKHPQCTFLPECERPSFTPIQNNKQNYSSVYLICKFLNSNLEDKRFCSKW
jgi:hypothetical protein